MGCLVEGAGSGSEGAAALSEEPPAVAKEAPMDAAAARGEEAATGAEEAAAGDEEAPQQLDDDDGHEEGAGREGPSAADAMDTDEDEAAVENEVVVLRL